jgi:hypothetical protein
MRRTCHETNVPVTRTCRPATRPAVGGALVALLLAAPSLSAQTLVGRVLDETTEGPVGGAVLRLLSADGEEEALTLADSVGRFRLSPPEAGEYYLLAERIGYGPTRSPLLALSTDGTAPVELMMTPAPLGLAGFEVSVEERAADELRVLGLARAQLGNRWIDRSDIEAIPIKRDMGTVLEWQGIAGLRVVRPENLAPGSADLGLCVSLQRARLGRGEGTCALIVLNGVPVAGPQAILIDPETIESMAVLLPVEATTQWGTLAGRGVVMIWTRR